jgi:subtilisin family serine protease
VARDTSDTVVHVWLFVHRATPLDTAVARAARAGARVRRRSRWLHAVSAAAPTSTLRALAREPALRRIQPLGRWRRAPTPSPDPRLAHAAPDTCPAGGDPVLGPSAMPYRRLNLGPLRSRGLDGAGVRVAVLDAGFNTLHPAFAAVTVTARHDFVFDDSVVHDEPEDAPGADFHGTAVWSLLAADVPGRLRGVAPAATYLLAKTEDIRSETPVEEDDYVAALEWADSIGVDIVSSSLAYLIFDPPFPSYGASDLTGDIAVTTVAVDIAAERGILVVTAAGNSGPGARTIWTPADADSALAVGAEDSLGTIASFSSRGPTADGRLKPDLTAPGVDVCVLVGTGVQRLAGTSFATPLIAAAATLIKQAHPGLGPVALADALRRSGSNREAPDATSGWGRPDAAAAAVFPLGVTPLEPVDSVLAAVTPVFRWTVGTVPASARPVAFRLRIAVDSTLGSLVFDSGLVDAEQHAPGLLFKPGPALFWRVDARAASGETATTGTIGGIAVPPWATLLTLSDPQGVTTDDPQPTFAWRPSSVAMPPGPFSYDLFVRRASAPEPVASYTALTDTSFTLPAPLDRGTTYRWGLVVRAAAETSLVPSAGPFLVLDPSLPPATLLYQNFPNPFPTESRAETCIWFDLAASATVELDILDLRGNLVRRLAPGPGLPSFLSAGRYGRGPPGGPPCDPSLAWDGTAADGRTVPAGVYLCKFKAGGVTRFRRIVFRGRAS